MTFVHGAARGVVHSSAAKLATNLFIAGALIGAIGGAWIGKTAMVGDRSSDLITIPEDTFADAMYRYEHRTLALKNELAAMKGSHSTAIVSR